MIVGEGTIFPGGGKTTSRDDLRGQASQTILVVERATPINWMDPTNEIRIEIALKGINRHPDGIGSEHPGGANILRADYTRFFESQTIEDNVLRDLLLLPPKPDEDE